jgi:hypothetical protein
MNQNKTSNDLSYRSPSLWLVDDAAMRSALMVHSEKVIIRSYKNSSIIERHRQHIQVCRTNGRGLA